MNIQIFGSKKCFDTKKAERYFKERRIKYQMIDMKEKGMSRGEFNSVRQALGGIDVLINESCKDKDLLALVTYISADDRAEKVLENQSVIKQPIVRNGRQAAGLISRVRIYSRHVLICSSLRVCMGAASPGNSVSSISWPCQIV